MNFLQNFDQGWQLYLNKNPDYQWCQTGQETDKNNNIECQHQKRFFQGEELSYLWKKPIFSENHQIGYDYANQWKIDPQYIKENYSSEYYKENSDGSLDVELTLYFKPQSYFYLGFLLTVIIVIINLLIIAIIYIKSVYPRKK